MNMYQYIYTDHDVLLLHTIHALLNVCMCLYVYEFDCYIYSIYE